MAFDGLFTAAIVHELQTLVSGRITRIHQPNAQELMLHIRANGQNHKLLCSIHPSYARMHLTYESIDNPKTPPLFCMMMRKHIEGGFIEKVEQYGADRVIQIAIRSKDEIGDDTSRILIMEIMGRHSNLSLINGDNQKIVETMKHLPPSMNSYRTMMPGQPYIYPPKQEKENPFLLTPEHSIPETKDDWMSQFQGVAKLHAEELASRQGKSAYDFLMSFLRGGDAPGSAELNGKTLFSASELTHLGTDWQLADSLAHLLDRVYYQKAERDRVKQQAGDLERWLVNERKKLTTKLKKLQADLTRAENLQEDQKKGELLMANLHLLERGMKEVEVVDYYDENQAMVMISLDPKKSPSQNAQNYFHRYNKAKTALLEVKTQMEKTEQELIYLNEIMRQLEQASPSDIEEIREELMDQGYLKKRAKTKQEKPSKPKPEVFVASDGTLISVGKNNKQNDYLTFKSAKRTDTWLHTKDIPGSHVVIHSDNPSEETLSEAAVLAAYFSKARDSSAVPVDYTEIRHVKKPNGSKPGFVIYFEQKTLYVTPDQETVRALQK